MRLRYWNIEKEWNERYRFMPSAQIPILPRRKRLVRMVDWYWFDFRNWAATKIAPWLKEEA